MLPKLPAPHLLIPNFLSAVENASLLAWVVANEEKFESGTVESYGSRTVNSAVRLCRTLNDLGPYGTVFRNRLQAGHREWMQAMKVSAFDLEKIELQVAAYADGAHFAFHVDSASGKMMSSRRLTGVYYFFREPRQFSGGEIRLFALGQGPDSENYVAITPQHNTLLLFPSWVGHDVTRVTCATNDFADSRFAVNCWLHQAKAQTPSV